MPVRAELYSSIGIRLIIIKKSVILAGIVNRMTL